MAICPDSLGRQSAAVAIILTADGSVLHLLRALPLDREYGRGGFFLACEDFGRPLAHSLPACAFFRGGGGGGVEITARPLIQLMSGSIHSGSAS